MIQFVEEQLIGNIYKTKEIIDSLSKDPKDREEDRKKLIRAEERFKIVQEEFQIFKALFNN